MANWAAAHQQYATEGSELQFPSETLVRMLARFKSPDGWARKNVLEVGCGSGNNLRMLRKLGLDETGVEFDDITCGRLMAKGFDIRRGSNTILPFGDNTFDYLVSWNVLHYESDEHHYEAGIEEYARVMRRGGRLFLSTTGPEHPIRESAKHLGGWRYQITKPDDFRCGDAQCFLESTDLSKAFQRFFGEVKVGQTTTDLFGEMLDWYIVTAVKT